MTYRVQLAPSAVRSLDKLSPRYVHAVIDFIYGPLAQNPQRVGKPLLGELPGLHSARRGAYRVIYELPDDATVLVIRVDHRAHAYRQR
ncbi:type II toxin-antitoxin system RelE/ParE family toxin [Gordonia sp. LSe1-13]|uniref:Type II toxin-antitoxin system RelE/ParE family toxin n=2 Tax=Gordonia TaxID=2053 RepID=A0ABU7M764_9ACTN|nr:type II toxin-antitoxin system RelE/ParE family toxin [Gordonia sp. LSe1-13]MEE4022321.1 type II toxin-antitoxin system RelE/ParE family toxin [Gordonia sp. PKS22-38]